MTDHKKECRETFQIYRDYSKHEDGLINNRMTWMILSQSFFFTTFALAIGRLTEVDTATAAQIITFLKAVAFLGIIVGLATSLSVISAFVAISGLSRHWTCHGLTDIADNARFQTEKANLPTMTGGGKWFASKFGIVLPAILPIFFAATWAVIWQSL